MKYRIEHRDPCYYAHVTGDAEAIPDRWVVEKVLEGGESITVGSFREHGSAVAMLSLMAATLEVENGAKVEYGNWTT